MHDALPSARPPIIFWPLLGLVLVLAAEGATALVFNALSLNQSILYLVAPVAALLTGIPGWFFFMGTNRQTTFKRALIVGILGVLITHAVMGLLFCIGMLFMPQDIRSQLFLVVTLLPEAFFFSLCSLVFAGWATIPTGILTSILIVWLQRILTRAQQRKENHAHSDQIKA